MSSIVVAGDTSGSVTLQAPATAGSVVVTLPSANGTMLTNNSTITPSAGSVNQAALATGVAGTGPAFSAYMSANQSISQNTWTKAQLNTKEFDTANCFDATTNYRFTPNVAGYYQVNFCLWGSSTSTYGLAVAGSIYKNGSFYKRATVNLLGGSAGSTPLNEIGTQLSAVIYMNGSTDYLEFYGYEYGYSANGIIEGGQPYLTTASAVLMRAA